MRFFCLVASALILASGISAQAGSTVDALGKTPTLRAPSLDEARKQALAWLEEQKADDNAKTVAEAIWSTDEGPFAHNAAMDRLAATFAVADPRARALVELCGRSRAKGPLAAQEWLSDESLAPFMRDNLRLVYGRWLVQQALYDEALEQIGELEATGVVDPATLLFFQSVVHHSLLNKDQGLKAADRLLTDVVDRPPRYAALAELMREDMKALEDDSLDHIARRMADIRRRLDLGRAGDKVRREEDGVIAALDKLIEELEKQQQQQQQQAGGGSGNMRPSQPMQDSNLARGSGEGNVDRKHLGKSSGWGDLPDKDREQALQQIGKDFPSHYRDIIEQYFRKLASEEEAPK